MNLLYKISLLIALFLSLAVLWVSLPTPHINENTENIEKTAIIGKSSIEDNNFERYQEKYQERTRLNQFVYNEYFEFGRQKGLEQCLKFAETALTLYEKN